MADKRIDQYDPIVPASTDLVLTQNPTTLAYSKSLISSLPSSGGGTVASVNGQTGTVVLTKSDVGLSNVDNTSDANKPVSTAQATSIATKEPTITAGTSAQYYRGDKTMQTLNQDAVPSGTTNKAYTATEQTKLAGIASGATANSPDATLLNRANHTGTQAESTITNLTTDLAAKQATLVSGTNIKTINGASVLGSGDLTVTGGSSSLAADTDVVITSPANKDLLTYDTATSKWTNQAAGSVSVPDATTTAKGVVQLAGDLAGTAAAPTVPSLANKAAKGANSDITSLSGLTTALSVPQGGTGAATLTGIVKGNGTAAMAAAVAGTDYVVPSGSITGSAAKWTTPRTLAGNSVDGSTNVAFANKFIVQGTADTGLSAAQFLGALGTGLLKNTTTTGILSVATAGTDYSVPTGTETLTNKTLTTPKVNQINDTNGKTSIVIDATASAVNYVEIANSATGQAPAVVANGTDTNLNMFIRGKGTGSTIMADGAGNAAFVGQGNGGTPVNYLTATNANTANAPILAAVGADTNIDVAVTPKGSGSAYITTSGGLKMTGSASAPTTPSAGLGKFVLSGTSNVRPKFINESGTLETVITTGDSSYSSWVPWIPTLTNITVGNGTLTGKAVAIGKLVHFNFTLTFGTTTSITSSFPSFSFPSTVVTSAAGAGAFSVKYGDTGVANYYATNLIDSAATAGFLIIVNTAGTYAIEAGVSSTVPFTFGNTDTIKVSGYMESA